MLPKAHNVIKIIAKIDNFTSLQLRFTVLAARLLKFCKIMPEKLAIFRLPAFLILNSDFYQNVNTSTNIYNFDKSEFQELKDLLTYPNLFKIFPSIEVVKCMSHYPQYFLYNKTSCIKQLFIL